MSDNRPIGILDSGLGGLAVIRQISRLMPNERIIYFGDTANGNYGDRCDDAIIEFAKAGAAWLISHDVKIVVVACSTISSVAFGHIEQLCKDIPVIGAILPGARAAVLRTAERKIGVIGTNATIRAHAYTHAIEKLDADIKVLSKACPLFIPVVEEGLLDTDVASVVAQHYLYEFIDRGVNCLILGCTYFPSLIGIIQGTVGTRVQLIDGALWTAKEAQDILMALDGSTLLRSHGLLASRICVSELFARTESIAHALLGAHHQLEVIKL